MSLKLIGRFLVGRSATPVAISDTEKHATAPLKYKDAQGATHWVNATFKIDVDRALDSIKKDASIFAEMSNLRTVLIDHGGKPIPVIEADVVDFGA